MGMCGNEKPDDSLESSGLNDAQMATTGPAR